KLGIKGASVKSAEKFMKGLCRVFVERDCSMAEINPLVVTATGELLALDAKMTFDDNAAYRHPELAVLRDLGEEDPSEVRAAKTVGVSVPLVVRLEGTEVEQGKKIIKDSGVNIIVADGLTDGAKKVVAAAKAA